MNEQLIVKNFGPIKDATVDFKRVTVFIGPTGGGKSTLAKLAAIFRERDFILIQSQAEGQKKFESFINDYGLLGFYYSDCKLSWKSKKSNYSLQESCFSFDNELRDNLAEQFSNVLVKSFTSFLKENTEESEISIQSLFNSLKNGNNLHHFSELLEKAGEYISTPIYIPAERSFATITEGASFGLRRAKAAIPITLENFLSYFEIARKNNSGFLLPIFKIPYNYINGETLLTIAEGHIISLSQAASGIQTTLPLILVVEDLQSVNEHNFIIEEPELNLYPTAQQGLLDWLVEKCTKGENDLTITTHSPYILSHLNLLIYAYQVAEKHPDRKEAVAAIVPEASWINPKEFACYQVENGGVQSLIDEELGLIDDNGLDNLSGDAADAFDNLIRLSKGVARK